MTTTRRLIAAGKGGAGKTTLTGSILYATMQKNDLTATQGEKGLKFFVLDADPAETLATAMSWSDSVPPMGIGQLKTELSEQDIPGDETTKMRFVLQQVMEKAIARIKQGRHTIDFAYMGHHHENSCLCAFNTAVNSVLMQILEGNTHDFVFLDRDAGLEHINRSVYNLPNDILMIVTWPRRDYLSVAQKILETAEDLGTTKHRFLVVNSPLGAAPDQAQVGKMLHDFKLDSLPHFVFPAVAREYDETLPHALDQNAAARDVLYQIVDFINAVG